MSSLSSILPLLHHHITLIPIFPPHLSLPIPSFTLVITFLLLLLTTRIILRIIHTTRVKQRLKTYQQQKQQQQQHVMNEMKEIQRVKGHDEIVNMTAVQVLDKMKTGTGIVSC